MAAWRKAGEEAQYTFTNVRVLTHLPNTQRSQQYLEKLRDDPGIKKVMRKYKWAVGVLQEMEPIGNTDMQSKTLGRNWNKGQVVEVRLRTDSYDGWRDYKTVRKTLCHELAHMVHSDHNREFWDLTNKLEKEVEAGDWTTGGRPLTNQVFYNPPESQKVDSGGIKGGTHRLGGGGAVASSKGSNTGKEKASLDEGLSRREIMARAAEQRYKKNL
ncbi:WLM domain-containing protein [Geopyxis carbonaria]|nr:WLM domain-containing protein [Geopyxis carbonaria]